MNIEEHVQHETIKILLKQEVQNNPNLTQAQKNTAMNNIDCAAMKADWIIDMLRSCGYLK